MEMDTKKSIYSDNILRHIKKQPSDHQSDSSEHIQLCQQTILNDTFHGFQHVSVPKRLLASRYYPIETAQKWLTLPGKDGKMYKFPLQTILPKVQMTRQVAHKKLPRDVEIDRRRRQYEKVNFLEKLKEAGLSDEKLLPSEEQYYMLTENAFKHFLPLSFFDNKDFDTHSPEAWLKLGVVEDGVFPLPVLAYLPKEKSLLKYIWQFAAVSAYNNQTEKWTTMTLADETTYEIPQIQIKFLAENPEIFVQRLKKAVDARDNAESLIKMESIVDCVLLQDLQEQRFQPHKKIDKLLKKLTAKVDTSFAQILKTEVYLIFEHLMACYELDKFVKLLPKEFPAFNSKIIRNALPKSYMRDKPNAECQKIKKLKLDMKQKRYDILKSTLFYIDAGIEAMENVAEECRYIETLSMFVTNFAKPLPLNDFLQSQQQNSNNIAAYLKNYWPQKVSSGIALVLRPQGKGWLDITLDKWSVYQMCKISRFIQQTKFRMQESMQVLLEKSIDNFVFFLSDPCLQFLELDANFTWPTDDFINTVFPYAKPIFCIVIGVSDEGKVFYSTPPDDFEISIMEIFKKALEKTSGVRCIDAETLTNLRFAPNLYILTVELIESLYLKLNDVLQRCYNKAVIPLLAYAKLFERFIPFYLLKVNDYIRDYEQAKKSSLQVKQDILEHKRQKEELRAILPANITIGAFLVIVEPIKQYLIKKHIEIVKRLFEYYVQRMYDINEGLLEQCTAVYNKISDRPQSIEHLYEIRDFGQIVPERVEQLKADIQIMWLEYDMLEGFFYNLNDAQFAMKWEVYAWPHNIMQRLTTLREEQKNDIEDFRRLHLSECIGFGERLESLNEEIQAFSLVFDPNRVMETSVEVKKTWKLISELQKLGNVLKYRQNLFELEELSLEFLDSIIEGFTPYRNLWLTCADFIKLEEATIGNPITNIELDDVWKSLEEIHLSLEASHKIFHEKVEVQGVASAFLEKVDGFIPVYNCIKWLKNEHWLFMHWQELAQRSGMEIKYSLAMNFLYCMRKGIMQHLDLVKEISDKAESEAEAIKKALEEEERLKEEARQVLLMRKAERKCRTDIL